MYDVFEILDHTINYYKEPVNVCMYKLYDGKNLVTK